MKIRIREYNYDATPGDDALMKFDSLEEFIGHLNETDPHCVFELTVDDEVVFDFPPTVAEELEERGE